MNSNMDIRAKFVIDADTLIAAHKSTYIPEVFPGLWESLGYYQKQGALVFIDKVFDEIKAPRDLASWKEFLDSSLIVPTDGDETIRLSYQQVLDWAKYALDPKFTKAALKKFGEGADGWLVAFAKENDAKIVTNETPERRSKSEIKLPTVCKEFGVKYSRLSRMLKELGAEYGWEQDR